MSIEPIHNSGKAIIKIIMVCDLFFLHVSAVSASVIIVFLDPFCSACLKGFLNLNLNVFIVL